MLWRSIHLLVGLLLAVRCFAEPSPALDRAREAIEAANREFIIALKTRDLRTIAAAYESDALQLSSGTELARGREAIVAFYRDFLEHATIIDATSTTLDVALADDTAIETGLYTLSVRIGDAPAVDDRGKYLTVWHHGSDGRWRIARESGNTSVAAAVPRVVETPRPAAAITPQKVDLDALAWLAGTWVINDAQQRIEEVWLAPSAGFMLGMSRSVRGGRGAAFEFMRIVSRAGEVFFLAQPAGRPAVEFPLQSWDGSKAIFANADPGMSLKRIIYVHNADGSVNARVEGERGGKPFAEDYPFRRLRNHRADEK